ncbi:hypothetical protein GIB67_039317 [Kingdonia uniflora]|uniref:Uncharacterized protein n=1 Tax=Kingdonia uniflora TaxID=39325 RepID=A0A7J7MM76_9MAGN|nr:hypothetical protein GIB67_039317 [Kingdonia uniflora]
MINYGGSGGMDFSGIDVALVESAIGRASRGSAVYRNEALAIVSFMLFCQALQYNVKVASNEDITSLISVKLSHQHQQAQQMMPQFLMAARASMLYTQPLSAMQQQQAIHGQIGISSSGNSGLHMMHNEGNTGYGVIVASKQDMGCGILVRAEVVVVTQEQMEVARNFT